MTGIRSSEVTPALVALLAGAGLPTDDLHGHAALRLFAAADEGGPAGCVALEVHGDAGLLRSLAVQPTRRGTGLGVELLQYAERQARHAGIDALYLLTTTAAGFFERHGYRHLARSEAPPSIAATTQFSGLCPASSDFMCKALRAGPP
jgi:amino-acid N-acetyltransferase